MASPLDSLSSIFPTKSAMASAGSSMMSAITVFLIIIVVAVVAGVITFIIARSLKYKHKIIVWEKINNNWEVAKKDRAMEIRYNRMGDTCFTTLKTKKYLPKPEIQTGKRTYWFAIREDNEWINIGMGDIDLEMRKAGAKFLHTEMRAWRTASMNNLKERYDKPKMWEKLAPILVPLIFFIIISVFLWFIVDKMQSVGDRLVAALASQEKTMELTKQVIQSLDNLCSGSGMKQ